MVESQYCSRCLNNQMIKLRQKTINTAQFKVALESGIMGAHFELVHHYYVQYIWLK